MKRRWLRRRLELELIAQSEDDYLVWLKRTTGSRVEQLRAILTAATWTDLWPFAWGAHKAHMRPYVLGDCGAARHSDDPDQAEDAGCSCSSYIYEGWHSLCEADHPDAIAVWECDGTGREEPRWVWRFRAWRTSFMWRHDPRRPLIIPAIRQLDLRR